MGCVTPKRAEQQQKCRPFQQLVWGFHGPAWPWLGGTGSRGYLPDSVALNTQITGHCARPGPPLGPWYTRRPPVCPARSEREERPAARSEAHWQCATHMHTSKYDTYTCYSNMSQVMLSVWWINSYVLRFTSASESWT